MNKLILTTPEELKQLITDSVQTALSEHAAATESNPNTRTGPQVFNDQRGGRLSQSGEANAVWLHQQPHHSIYQAGQTATIYQKRSG